ncbi:MAG: hypothetical protein ABIG44_04945 [Planctomycetota bacterium]
MTSNHERPFDDLRNTLGEYAGILRQRWRLALVGLGIVASFAFWHSQFLPRRYRANTLFERRDDVVLRNLVHSNSPYSFDNLRSTIVMDMTGSRAMAEAAIVIGILEADAIPPEGGLHHNALRAVDAALSKYKLSAEVQFVHKSPGLDTIRLDCESNDPRIAQQFVTALRERYISETRAHINEILISTKEFFELEIGRYQEQLTQVDLALHERFREFPGVNPTDPASVGTRLEELRRERDQLLTQKVRLEAQTATREQILISLAKTSNPAESTPAASGTTTNTPKPIKDLITAIEQVERELAEATTVRRMTAQHPEIKALLCKLDGLRATLASLEADYAQQAAQRDAEPKSAASAASTALNPEYVRAELELGALYRDLESVQAAYAQAAARTGRLTGLYESLLERGEELRDIRDQHDQDIATIATWRKQLGLLDRILTAESEQRGTQFALIEGPKETDQAISPRISSVFAVCLGSGLAAAALLVALAELLDRSFRSTGQITRALGIPVLECVGVIRTPQERRRRLCGQLIWVPTVCLLLSMLLTTGALAYVSLEHPWIHRSAVDKLDGALHSIGVPDTGLVTIDEE